MKTRKLYQIISITLFSIIGILMLTGVITFENIAQLIFPGSLIYGFATTAGFTTSETPTTQTAADANARLLLDTVDKRVTVMKPDKTPIDTIMRWISRITNEKSWKTVWYSVDIRPVEDTIATAFDTSAPSTVTSSSLGQVHQLTVTNAFVWNVDDRILFQDITGGDGKNLVVHITAKSGTLLSVIAINGFGSDTNDLPDIPAASAITRMGPAKRELDAQTTPYATYPEDEYNWHQRRQADVRQSYISKNHPQEVDFDINDFKAQALFDMRYTAEIDLIAGARARKYDPDTAEYLHSFGGLLSFIDKVCTYTEGAIENDDFTRWTKQVFTGNSGSALRYMFIGKDLMEDLENVDFIQKQLSAENTEVEFGITFNKIITNFGQFRILYDSVLDVMGMSKKGIILDFAHIEKSVMEPLEMTRLELKKTGTSDAEAWHYNECWAPKVKYGGEEGVHAVIQPSSASASA